MCVCREKKAEKKLSNTYHYILIVCLIDLLLVFHWFHMLIFIHWHIIRTTITHTHAPCIHLMDCRKFFFLILNKTIFQRQWHKTPWNLPNRFPHKINTLLYWIAFNVTCNVMSMAMYCVAYSYVYVYACKCTHGQSRTHE